MSANQQNNIDTNDFVIYSGDNIPVYNVLMGGYISGVNEHKDFTTQFRLPKPKLMDYKIHVPIHLSDFTYQKPQNAPINIFNEACGTHVLKQEVSSKRKEIDTSESTAPHSFAVFRGQMAKVESQKTFTEQLRPVPLVQLNKKQQSYTREINHVMRQNPISKGSLHASDSMIGIVIGFVLFFMYIRMSFGRQMNLFFSGLFNYRRADHTQKDGGLVTKRVSFLLNILYFFTIGLLFQHNLDYQGLQIFSYSQLEGFLTLSGVVITAYLLKWLFGNILAHILNIQEYTKAYFFHIFVYNKVFAIIVFPVLLALPYIYTEWVELILPSILILALFLYVLRFFRILILSIQRKLSIFYLFLYLCALEITPILVIIMMVQDWLKLSAL